MSRVPAIVLSGVLAVGAVTGPAADTAPSDPCRNGFMMIQDTRLWRVDETGLAVAVAHLPVQLNAAGYAPAEELVYALADTRSGSRIVTVDGDGKVTDRGPVPAGLDGAYAADISQDRWLIRTGDGAELITLTLPGLTVGARVRVDDRVDVGDWAMHSADGRLYGISSGRHPRLLQLDPESGRITTIAQPAGLASGSAYGAIAISPLGELLAVHNATGHLYRLGLDRPRTVHRADLGLPAYHADAAGCPAAWDHGPVGDPAPDPPRHTVTTIGQLSLGETVDAEPAARSGDTDDAMAEPATIDAEATSWHITVTVRNTTGQTALLAGWHDLDRNGRFDAADLASAPVEVGATTAVLTWPAVTVNTGGDVSSLRLRLYGSTDVIPQPTGTANGGEVEDHEITVRWPRPRPAETPFVPASQPPQPLPAPSPTTQPARATQPPPAPSPTAEPDPHSPTPDAATVDRPWLAPASGPLRTRPTPLTWSVFAGLVVPALAVVARSRARSRR